MRLKRLELQGFKSFLHRTILTFDSTITGVVGPNGCGKSNIVDAIQWVMGEQSAKHLRGEAMTDVIFNGSDTQAPTSMAEVTLVLDRTGVAIGPQFAAFDKADEISVTRRVYRDGTGEYFINKTLCRLKDIHELFMDTGVGKRAYSIIEQGQIDRMVNVKPEERRLLFEEVAGITKYKTKRKEAEKKLEMTRQNMVRLQDIVTELEKQIRSLKVQATRARKYKELKTEIETLDLHLLGRNFFRIQREIAQLTAHRTEVTNARAEADARFASIDTEVTTLELKRVEQEQVFQSLGANERDLSLKLKDLENQILLLEQQQSHLKESLAEGENEEAEILEEITRLETDEAELRGEQGQIIENAQRLASQREGAEENLRAKQSERTAAVEKQGHLRSRRESLSSKANSLRHHCESSEARKVEIATQVKELEGKQGEIVDCVETHRLSLESREKKITECSDRIQHATGEVAQVSEECQSISHSLSDLEERLFGLRETFHSKKSRLQSLKELEANLEGYSPTAREMLQRIKGSVNAVPFAEVIQPEAEFEDSLEVLLGDTINTLVVQTSQDAEALVRVIRDQGLERVKIVALSELQSGENAALPAQIIPVMDKIRVQPGYEAAARWCLGQAFLCCDAESVLSLRKTHPEITLVSDNGQTVSHKDRSISSGVVPTKTGVFARRREIEELKAQSAALEIEVEKQSTERENLLQHLQAQERLHAELKDRLSQCHIENVEHRKEKEKVQSELARAQRDRVGIEGELQRGREQIEDLTLRMRTWEDELETLKAEDGSLAGQMQEADGKAAQAGADVDALFLKLQELKVELSRLEEKRQGVRLRLEDVSGQLESAVQRKENVLSERQKEERQIEELVEETETISRRRQEADTNRNRVLVELSDMGEALKETGTALLRLKDERSSLGKRRDEVVSQSQEVELKLASEQSSLEQLRAVSVERYGREPQAQDETVTIELEQLPLLKAEAEDRWAELSEPDRALLLTDHLQHLREKVSRYGEVNLTAIHEFDEIQKRYDFLTEQKNDLEKSIAILEQAILKIDESTAQRFADTFEAVNAKFKEIFPILFNGGKAELTLTQNENLLDAGVEIMVHPPGKRPASISLLSGGEKALTAVSLVLAIFARKPSPFCLLDEVDAPLDDANVSRFNTVVRKMAEKTQFIVITHNKKTMEMTDALYGVTMERSGVSKMTSVSLH